MKFQFYRFYLLVVLAGTLLIFSFNKVFSALDESESRYQIEVDYLIAAFENGSKSTEDTTKPVDNLARRIGLPQFKEVSIETLALPLELRNKLDNGDSISLLDTDGKVFYYKLAQNEGKVIQLGPVAKKQNEVDYQPYLIMVFYSSLAILLLLFMRPLFKDLSKIQSQAVLFGRSPEEIPLEVKESSSIFPLAKSLSNMSRKVLGLIQIHQDLSRTISHEIRTPLTRMKFMLEIISAKIESSEKQQLLEDVKEIEVLVEEYLSFAKVESIYNSVKLKTHLVDAFLKLVGAKFSVYQDSVSLELSAKSERANFDSSLMLLVLQNLISNSLKFANQKIHVEMGEKENCNYLFVEDDGPGITDNPSKLVQAFARAESQAESDKGFGLGLYIVQKVAIWHGGRFLIERSSSLGGARMILEWPKNNPEIESKS